MNDPLHPSKFDAKIRAALSAPEPDAGFVDRLEARLLAAPVVRSTRPGGWMRRAVWVGGMAVLALTVIFWIVGPQNVLAAVRGWLGYVPDIGYVQTGTAIRVLAGPVEQQRDGVVLTVEQVVADAERTVVVFTVEGLGPQHRPGAEGAPVCLDAPQLLLSGGGALDQTGGEGSGWPSGYRSRSIFPAVPAHENGLILLLPCLDDTRPGGAPENWALPLAIHPAPPDFNPLPVVELIETLPTVTAASAAGEITAVPAADLRGIRLEVERYVELDDGYLIQGSFDWSHSPFEMPAFDSYALRAYDANGQAVPVEPVETDLPTGDLLVERRLAWSLRTNSKQYNGPLNVTLPALAIDQDVEAAFEFDMGQNPQPGQTWELNRVLDVEDRQVTVSTARLEASPDGMPGMYELVFKVEFDPAQLLSISLHDPDNRSAMLSGGGGGGGGSISQSMNYDYLPTGPRRIVIDHITYPLTGPWIATVDLPPVVGKPVPDAPPACLTVESAAQLQVSAAGLLPPGLSGSLLVSGPPAMGAHFPTVYVAGLDGAQKYSVGAGGWADLSPEARRVVYSTSDGMYLADLESGENTRLPWAQPTDYNPRWSPDGDRIAFVRSGDGIYVAQLDGTGLQRIANTGVSTFLAGWLPDGQRLMVTEMGADGSALRTIDLQTGAVTEHFLIDNLKGGFVLPSPDGLRVAFGEKVFGQAAYGVFTANIDGTGKRLVAGLDAVSVTASAWSLDGRWLLVTALEPGLNTTYYKHYLIQPESCEVIRLDGIDGPVEAWR